MEKFSGDRYLTRGICKLNEINPTTYLYLWNLVDEMEVEKDCLQQFILRTKTKARREKVQVVEHLQEVPPYRIIHCFRTEHTIDAKVFVIALDEEKSVMLLAEEC